MIVLANSPAGAGRLLQQIGFREGEDFRCVPGETAGAAPGDILAVVSRTERPGRAATEIAVSLAGSPGRELRASAVTEMDGDIVRGSHSNLLGLPLAEFTGLLRDPLFQGKIAWRVADPVEPDDPPPVVSPVVDPVLVLASASPRRQAIVRGIIGDHRVMVVASEHEEHPEPGESAGERVRRLAREKALMVAESGRYPSSVRAILAADTEVVVDGESLGKPGSAGDARRMLRLLAGRSHQVLTGIAVLGPGRDGQVDCVSTEVRFRPMGEEEIDAYVASGEPMDKAGAYAIQGRGAMFVGRIDGSYTNVVGLPVGRVREMLGFG